MMKWEKGDDCGRPDRCANRESLAKQNASRCGDGDVWTQRVQKADLRRVNI